MARAGLGLGWKCLWANDFSETKSWAYHRNWGGTELHQGDVADVKPSSLPKAFLAWASFPCQDLSLAGDRIGIGHHHDEFQTRSGTFWPFWKLMKAQKPPVVVIENVVGALTTRDGADINAIFGALASAGYSFGPVVMDAVHWLPQSRPRLFIIAVRRGVTVDGNLASGSPTPFWHPKAIQKAFSAAIDEIRKQWIWWNLPLPKNPVPRLETLINEKGDSWVDWDSPTQTEYLLSLMNETHLQRVKSAMQLNKRIVGTAYRRTREGRQRAEVRFDGVAGCLRTAGGGSSKQIVFEVTGKRIRTRLMSPREAARLQGLSDDYQLPNSFNDAYDLVGDGLCVPVVAYLRDSLLDQLAEPHSQIATA